MVLHLKSSSRSSTIPKIVAISGHFIFTGNWHFVNILNDTFFSHRALAYALEATVVQQLIYRVSSRISYARGGGGEKCDVIACIFVCYTERSMNYKVRFSCAAIVVVRMLQNRRRNEKKIWKPFVQCRKRWKEYHNNHKNGNHFLNARLENYLLVSDPTYRLGEQREDREEKKHTHKPKQVSRRRRRRRCQSQNQSSMHIAHTNDALQIYYTSNALLFCWLTFYELHQRRRLFEEDEKKTLEMKRAAIDIVEQRL